MNPSMRSLPFRESSQKQKAIGCMGATELAPKIRKRYQTNELAADSTEFGTRGSEVQILSPRPSTTYGDSLTS